MEQLHDKLKAWIDNPNREHSEGVSLLTHLTRNKRLIKSLSQGESRYKREKLLYELQKHYKPLPSIIITSDKSDTDQGQSAQNDIDKDLPPVDLAGGESEATGDGTGSETPPADNTEKTGEGITPPGEPSAQDKIVADHLEIGYSKMFNKKGMLSNQLRDLPEADNEGRKALMEQIAGLRKDMDEVEAKINHFKIHGVLPAQDPEPPEADISAEVIIPDDPILMNRLLLNERSNLSKIKSKIRNGQDNPDKLKVLEDLLVKKSELVNEIVRRLDGNGS